MAYFETLSENSARNIISNLSYSGVQRISSKLVPHKYRPIQALLVEDAEKRLVFCHWYISYCLQNIYNFCYISWTDESNVSNSAMNNRKKLVSMSGAV